jgi:Leucine-rich repeat (LRR) protein
LYLNGNFLKGTIPTKLGVLPQWDFLYLSSNQLAGMLPANLLASTSLRRLSVQDNQLSGPIPDASSSTGGTTSKLDCLNLSFNRFDVSLPAITSQRQCRLTTKFQPFGTAFISLKSYN